MEKLRNHNLTLVDFLEDRANTFNERVALLFKPGFRFRRLSYRGIWEDSGKIATLLQQRGLQKGDRVIIWGPNCPEWVLAFFGCLRAGIVVIPLDLRSSREFVENIASRVDAKLSFVSRVTPDYHSELGINEIDFEEIENLSLNLSQPEPVDIKSEDLAEVMFTSGTTGDPKGVMLTHKNIVANLASVTQVTPGKTSDSLLSILPLSHMLEQMGGLLTPLTAGASITYPTSRQPMVLFRTMKERKVTMMILVPQLLDLFMKGIEREVARQGKDLLWKRMLTVAKYSPYPIRRLLFRNIHQKFGGKLSLIFAGGAPLDPELGKKWNLIGIRVIQGYGATEAAPVIACHPQQKPRFDSPGPALPGVQIKIAEDGEVLIRGDNVTAGYLDAPEATSAAFVDGWYKTGDQGEIDQNGFLHLKGRKKDMIVLGSGLNVYPEDIETILQKHELVSDAAVIGMPGSSGPEIHAVLIMSDQSDGSDAVRWTNEQLADHQRIRGITIWDGDDFPRTHTLKVKKGVLIEMLNQQSVDNEPAASSTSDGDDSLLHKIVADIAEIAISEISDEKTLDDDLDLDSLKRVEILSAVEAELGVSLDESLLSPGTTFGQLAKLISQGSKNTEEKKFVKWGMSWWCRPLRSIIHAVVVFPILNMLFQQRTVGTENLEKLNGPVLFASNHTLKLDNGILMKALPRRHRSRLAIAAWDELWDNPLYKITHPLIGNAFPFSKEGNIRPSLENLGKILDNGWSVLIYPEGDRTVEGPMKPFLGGTGLIALESGIPVVPIKLDIKDSGVPLDFPIKKKGQVEVRFGKPINFSPGTSYEEATTILEDNVRNL